MKSKDQALLEEAYKQINEEQEERNFEFYTGSNKDIMFFEDFDGPNLQRKMDLEGKHFKTVYLVSKEDAFQANYKVPSSVEYLVFYKKEDFPFVEKSRHALIPV